jgi:hypothetical protein
MVHIIRSRGDIAQLGERGVRIAEVGGSNPPISTKTKSTSLSEKGRGLRLSPLALPISRPRPLRLQAQGGGVAGPSAVDRGRERLRQQNAKVPLARLLLFMAGWHPRPDLVPPRPRP